MTPVPLWKVQREIDRVRLQLFDVVARPIRSIRQATYDRAFPENVRISQGRQEPGKSVALYVVFQPDGLRKSALETCRYLTRCGYSTVVVSNAPLSDADRQELLDLTCLFVERENYGYDFGGYRDGLRIMALSGIAPDTLIIMNDSIWFPVTGDGRMFDRFESEPADFQGPVFEWKGERGDRNAHFQSYFYLVRKPVLEHPAFQEFWQRYPLSSEKRVVLIEGEKGLTRHLVRAGAIKLPVPTRTRMIRRLGEQETACLKRVLDYAAYETVELHAEALALIDSYAEDADWREKALAHMERALEKAQPMGTFPYAGLTIMSFDFLKKSSYPKIHDGMRWQYMRAVRAGHLPEPSAEVLAEIKASPMSPHLTTDPAFRPARR